MNLPAVFMYRNISAGLEGVASLWVAPVVLQGGGWHESWGADPSNRYPVGQNTFE